MSDRGNPAAAKLRRMSKSPKMNHMTSNAPRISPGAPTMQNTASPAGTKLPANVKGSR